MVSFYTKSAFCLGLLLAGGACNVDPGPGQGGIDSGIADSESRVQSAARCATALAVLASDYRSSNVSAVSQDGTVLSESMISSGAASSGLSAPLSGDLALPLTAPASGQLVILERTPSATLTWVDPSTATVTRQVSVGTGFDSNPHDYLEVGGGKAYITRYDSNPNPGLAANDGGGDVLVLDTATFAIANAKTIPLAGASDGLFLPRPDRMLPIGNEVWVSLHRYDKSYLAIGDARLVGISTADDTVAWTLDLPGVADCGAIAVSPSGRVVALSCSGELSANPVDRSAIVLLDATTHPPIEITRLRASSYTGAPFGFSLAFAAEDLLIGTTLGDMVAKRNDSAFILRTGLATASEPTTGDATTTALVAEALIPDAGQAFALGDVHCQPGCSELCFMADATMEALRVWKVVDGTLREQPSVRVDPTLRLGLPPRSLGPILPR